MRDPVCSFRFMARWRSGLALAAIASVAACAPEEVADAVVRPSVCQSADAGEVTLAGGEFLLGAAPQEPEEGPPRRVSVGPFAIDRTEVTNAQFRAFVEATGYVTSAERQPDPALYPGVDPALLRPSSVVFVGAEGIGDGNPGLWWRVIDGASWRQPGGPGSSIAGRDHHPVVHVSHEDAMAYAAWRGRTLPSEAEWEFAARGGIDGARFEWGAEGPQTGKARANTWQGVFPAVDTGGDGYKADTAPVGCFEPNAYGLFDMTGNVWEWTSDYLPGQPPTAAAGHLIKGGSYLCADTFCARYRPSARQEGPSDTGSSHVGFRTIRRLTP